MNRRKKIQNGSVLIMVTFALIAMCGLLGLAVDLGWSYSQKKSAQAAADTAAIAAVAKAKSYNPTAYICDSVKMDCLGTPTACSSIADTSNLKSACLYAEQNGFKDGVGNVKVTVTANACPATCEAPTAPGVEVFYWVTVRVTQQIPQLFSAVLGNTTGLVSSRATAALTNVVFNASLDLLNRQNDTNPLNGTGVNLVQQGGNTLQSTSGMFVASTLPATAQQGGSSSVKNTPFSWFRGNGTCGAGGNLTGPCLWDKPWVNGKPDGKAFGDPTASLKNPDQPTVYNGGADRVVDTNTNKGFLGPGNPPGVTGTGKQGDPWILPPGNYYAATCTGGGANRTCTPTGGQMAFDKGYYQFGNGGSTFQASDQWQFFGGLNAAGGTMTITFSPGRYVFAGTTNANPQFVVSNGTTINDAYSGTGYQGELILFTNQNYSTLAGPLFVPSALLAAGYTPASCLTGGACFNFGESGFKVQAGSNAASSLSLHGLDGSTTLPDSLQNWAPFLMWQDRGDSTVLYYPHTGLIATPVAGVCPPGSAPESSLNGNSGLTDVACTVTPPNPKAPQMDLNANAGLSLKGAVYQPRGAWLSLNAGATLTVPLQIVTGAVNMQGNATLTLTGLSNPITIITTALIE